MNKHQWVVVAVVAVNLVLIGLFPPFDWLSVTRTGARAFDGFAFAFGDHGSRAVNWSFLQLELFVVIANGAIAWLMLRAPGRSGGIDWQKMVLIGVGVNLALILLFPPMQHTSAVVRALVPSFDGFYFVMGDYQERAIVTNLLYLEVLFILINGAILYLLFRKSEPVELTANDRARLAAQLRR